MIDDISTLRNLIEKNELKEHKYTNVELKESWSQKYGIKLSALGNKIKMNACWFVVGLKDNGDFSGRDEKWAKQTEEILSQQMNEHLDPIQTCIGMDCLEVAGNWIVIVKLSNPGEVVYWNTIAYVGSGTTTRPMEPQEALELRLKLPGRVDFTKKQITDTYDPILLKNFLDDVRRADHLFSSIEDSDNALNILGIHATQASRILFGSCSYRIVRYDANGEPLSNEKHRGLYKLVTADFHKGIQSWTSEMLKVAEQPYPDKALKEALANAVAHAAYFEDNGDIILELYPDHLTVSNLCLRESEYFANRWFSRAHKTVNALLMEVLRISKNVDELGRGKNLIFSECIKRGKKPPQVVIQKAGKYSRWALNLYGGIQDQRLLKLHDRVQQIFGNQSKTLIALALVLWRDRSVTEIRNYIDDSFSDQFADVLSSLDGPIFYWKEEDKIVLTRWAKILLREGKDSRKFSPEEEKRLLLFLRDYCMKYTEGYITPVQLRTLGHMADTPSEQTLSSNLLQKWFQEGHIERVGKGKFKFIKKMPKKEETVKQLLLNIFSKSSTDSQD